MADKEATVYIVDVARSMGEKRHGRSITDLEWAMQYVWDKITTTVSTGRKTANVGVIALRADDTSNELQDEDSFANISVISPLKQFLMPDIRKLQNAIQPSHTYKGDAISALVLAIHMISTHCRKLKYKRKIVLITNGTGLIDPDNVNDIKDKMKEDNIELFIFGPDFDDVEWGVKEEDKDERKALNEKFLRDLASDCPGGTFATLENAVANVDIPETKDVRIVPTFKGFLTLGDPGKYETALRIPVERCYKTSVAKPPSASSFVPQSGTKAGQDGGPSATQEAGQADSMTSVRMSRTYQIDDESAPGGKVDVERDDLAKGYEYGRTAVHISEADENITSLTTYAGLDIIGFIDQNKYDRYLQISQVSFITASKGNKKGSLALSSLIHALYEAEDYAVARLVIKEAKPPILVLLAPYMAHDFECLLEAPLPYTEDLRTYRFPSLDKVATVSGKIVTEHRNLPTASLQESMDQFVDSMELNIKDDDGDTMDELPIDFSYSPVLHRIQSAIKWRAVHPEDPIQEPSATLTRFSHPEEDLVNKSKQKLENLIAAADVKKVPPKTKGRKRNREAEKPLSGLDVDALLNLEPKRAKISPENAIPEFKQFLSRADNVETIDDAAKQMSDIIENQIKHSLGDANYERVVEGLGTMREELVEYEEPALYNELVRDLKEKILGEKLGGDRKELWWLIRKGKLGLIDQDISERSEVLADEAAAFLVPS
ncbi:hypothetical protein N7478_009518 [Penicillium angulare]|uniref:uncharacterized protein n=1 Tax=Penicillium angulare TaxID=116970 RepID=UPI002540D86D|nr:uncharacterized protein N7478_009518 [Penicillium angulare]KAJ5266710.1 hypothetical protein N7478_009518 [Penicillium angulare]